MKDIIVRRAAGVTTVIIECSNHPEYSYQYIENPPTMLITVQAECSFNYKDFDIYRSGIKTIETQPSQDNKNMVIIYFQQQTSFDFKEENGNIVITLHPDNITMPPSVPNGSTIDTIKIQPDIR